MKDPKDMKVEELRNELRRKKLDSTGKKAALIARLEKARGKQNSNNNEVLIFPRHLYDGRIEYFSCRRRTKAKKNNPRGEGEKLKMMTMKKMKKRRMEEMLKGDQREGKHLRPTAVLIIPYVFQPQTFC